MEDLVEQVLAARRGRSKTGLATCVGIALGLHAAAFGVFAISQSQSPEKRHLEYVAIRAVPLQALGHPEAALPKRPTPKPVPSRSEAEPPSPEPPTSPKTRPNSPARRPPERQPDDSKSPPEASSVPVPQPAEADERSPPGPTGSEQGKAQGTSAFGTHLLEGIDPDFTYDYYLDRMLALIHDQWQKPTAQGSVHAVVRFTVQKTGEILELELAETSGSNAFDLAALRAIRNANPLPRLPASYRRSALKVTLIVRSE